MEPNPQVRSGTRSCNVGSYLFIPIHQAEYAFPSILIQLQLIYINFIHLLYGQVEISTFIITLSVIGKCRHRPTRSLSRYGFESVMKSLHRSRLSNTCRQWTRTLIGQCLPFNRFRHTFKVLTLNLLSFYLQKMKRDLLIQKHTIGFYRKVSANTVEVKIMIDEFKSALISIA